VVRRPLVQVVADEPQEGEVQPHLLGQPALRGIAERWAASAGQLSYRLCSNFLDDRGGHRTVVP